MPRQAERAPQSRRRRELRTLDTAVLMAVVSVPALGLEQLPDAQNVRFSIHADPNDPNSAVILTIDMHLQSRVQDGLSIGWSIESIVFTEYDPNGNVSRSWTDATVTTSEQDGHWWVEHEDPSEPETEEFAVPPALSDTAESNDPNGSDLKYDSEGIASSTTPFEITAVMDCTLQVQNEPAVLIETVAESMEVPPGDPPPSDS